MGASPGSQSRVSSCRLQHGTARQTTTGNVKHKRGLARDLNRACPAGTCNLITVCRMQRGNFTHNRELLRDLDHNNTHDSTSDHTRPHWMKSSVAATFTSTHVFRENLDVMTSRLFGRFDQEDQVRWLSASCSEERPVRARSFWPAGVQPGTGYGVMAQLWKTITLLWLLLYYCFYCTF